MIITRPWVFQGRPKIEKEDVDQSSPRKEHILIPVAFVSSRISYHKSLCTSQLIVSVGRCPRAKDCSGFSRTVKSNQEWYVLHRWNRVRYEERNRTIEAWVDWLIRLRSFCCWQGQRRIYRNLELEYFPVKWGRVRMHDASCFVYKRLISTRQNDQLMKEEWEEENNQIQRKWQVACCWCVRKIQRERTMTSRVRWFKKRYTVFEGVQATGSIISQRKQAQGNVYHSEQKTGSRMDGGWKKEVRKADKIIYRWLKLHPYWTVPSDREFHERETRKGR